MTPYRDGDHPSGHPTALDAAPAETLGRFRRALLALLVVGLVGTALELVLMEHLEDWWQRIPLLLIGSALGMLLWHGIAGSRASIFGIRVVMTLCVASAAGGVILHVKGNREFALESRPGLAGREAVTEMLMGAFPALAPGTMALLGLIGLLFTWRHPSLASGG